MTLDQAMKRITQLERDNAALREHFTPPSVVPTPGGWWVFLDGYEITNLRSALTAILTAPLGNPLLTLNSGDWVGQIEYRLKNLSSAQPNCSPEGYIERATR